MKRSLILCAVILMMLVAYAPPVSANAEGEKILSFQGTARVGKAKLDTDGPNNGCDDVTGGGLGLPVISQAKNAWMKLTTTVMASNSPGMPGTMNLCLRLLPFGDNTVTMVGAAKKGIGAACGASKGHDGRGVIDFPAGPKTGKHWLSDVGWKMQLGETVAVSGKIHRSNAAQGKDKSPVDGFQGIMIMTGGAACASKRDNPKLGAVRTSKAKPPGEDGATQFNVAGTWTVVPNGAFFGNRNDRPGSPKGSNDMPVFCKKGKGEPDPCIYQTKK